MAKLNWGAAGQRFYEAGADRGVLYPNGGSGVAWSGLVSVEEKSNGGSPQAFFVDGLKYANVAEASEFEASLSAISAPSEFGSCDGTVSLANGLFATEQPRQSFGLSYRTLIGNETEGLEKGYKLHLVYNALAAPSSRSNTTLSDSPEVLSLSWELSTKPVRLSGARPTAHLVIDSTKADRDLLNLLEAYLYGAEGINPVLPTPAQLLTLFNSWAPLGLSVPMKLQGFATSGLKTYKNLATNPSFESTSGTVEVRRNLAQNPAASNGGTLFATYGPGPGETGTTTFVTNASDGPTPALRSYGRRSTTAPKTSASTGWSATSGANRIPSGGVAGDVVTVSVWIRYSGSSDLGVRLRAQFLDANNVGVGGSDAPLTALPANTWVRLTSTATATAAYSFIGWWAYHTSDQVPAAGTTLDITGLLVERTSAIATYFDGSTSPDPDLTSAWLGTPHASQSVLSGERIISDDITAAAQVVASTHWSSSGSKSLRAIPVTPTDTNNTWVAFNARRWAGVVSGKTYTMCATLRLTAPQVGSLHRDARKIRAYFITSDGTIEVSSDAAPNTAGVHPMRLTFTIPTGTITTGFIYLYNGTSAGNGDVWYDDLMLVEGDYLGPYFDGSQLPALAKNYSTNSVPTNAGDFSYQMGTGEVSTSTLVTGASDGPLPYVNSYVRRNITTPKTAGNSGFFSYNRGGTPLVVGTTWTAAVWVRPSHPIVVALSTTPRVALTSIAVGTGSQGEYVNLPAGVWTRLVGLPITINAEGANSVGWWAVIPGGSNIPAGGTLDVTAPMVVEGSTMPTFFSGASPDGMWLGSPNNSPSIRYDTRQRVRWDGAANASSSALEQFLDLDVPTEPGEAFLIGNDLWVYDGRIWLNKGIVPRPI